MERTMDDNTWTTREGETVAISDMGDRHLCNTIKMLWRERETRQTLSDLEIVRSVDLPNSVIDEMTDTSPSEWLWSIPKFQNLCKEATRRIYAGNKYIAEQLEEIL
jgi:hypothetical protein